MLLERYPDLRDSFITWKSGKNSWLTGIEGACFSKKDQRFFFLSKHCTAENIFRKSKSIGGPSKNIFDRDAEWGGGYMFFMVISSNTVGEGSGDHYIERVTVHNILDSRNRKFQNDSWNDQKTSRKIIEEIKYFGQDKIEIVEPIDVYKECCNNKCSDIYYCVRLGDVYCFNKVNYINLQIESPQFEYLQVINHPALFVNEKLIVGSLAAYIDLVHNEVHGEFVGYRYQSFLGPLIRFTRKTIKHKLALMILYPFRNFFGNHQLTEKCFIGKAELEFFRYC